MTSPTGTQTDSSHRLADLVAFQPEQLFRAIFEQAAVGIALIETTTGRFLRVNQRYCEIVGLSRDDMTAMTFMAITHPDDLQTDLSNMEELKAGRIRDFCMEKRYFQSDGSIVWVDVAVSPLWEFGEQPSFHIAVVQDISERKRAEQNLAKLNDTLEQRVAQRTRELEESRQQLQAIVDATSDAVFVKNLDGRYLLVNRAMEQFVGKRQDEVIGRDDRLIIPPALFPGEGPHRFPGSHAVETQCQDREHVSNSVARKAAPRNDSRSDPLCNRSWSRTVRATGRSEMVSVGHACCLLRRRP